MLSFAHAVRISVNYNEGIVVDVSRVSLVAFGSALHLQVKKSIGGSAWTSWYVPFEKDRDFGKITVADLVHDPAHYDVFYLLFEDEEAADIWKITTLGFPVIDYIRHVVTNFATTVQSPRIDVSTEDYFLHQLEFCHVPAFHRLLRTPKTGFDYNGFDYNAGGDYLDLLLLIVEQEQNFDPESSGVYFSRRTLKLRTLKLS